MTNLTKQFKQGIKLPKSTKAEVQLLIEKAKQVRIKNKGMIPNQVMYDNQ